MKEIVDERYAAYGHPVENMRRTAAVWSGILNIPVTPEQVALCFAGHKLVRAEVSPDYSDNYQDAMGYLEIFQQVVGDRMVQARSVQEYENKRAERDRVVPPQDWVQDALPLHMAELGFA